MKEEKVKVREMGTHETSWDIMGLFPVELEVGQLFDFCKKTQRPSSKAQLVSGNSVLRCFFLFF